jgi:hypothetical protein
VESSGDVAESVVASSLFSLSFGSEDGNFDVNFYQTTRRYNLEHVPVWFNDSLGFSLYSELERICKEAVVA